MKISNMLITVAALVCLVNMSQGVIDMMDRFGAWWFFLSLLLWICLIGSLEITKKR